MTEEDIVAWWRGNGEPGRMEVRLAMPTFAEFRRVLAEQDPFLYPTPRFPACRLIVDSQIPVGEFVISAVEFSETPEIK